MVILYFYRLHFGKITRLYRFVISPSDIIFISEWAIFGENNCTQVGTYTPNITEIWQCNCFVCLPLHAVRTIGLLLSKYSVLQIVHFFLKIFFAFWSLLVITVIMCLNVYFKLVFVLSVLILSKLSLSFANPVNSK